MAKNSQQELQSALAGCEAGEHCVPGDDADRQAGAGVYVRGRLVARVLTGFGRKDPGCIFGFARNILQGFAIKELAARTCFAASVQQEIP